MLVPAVAPRTKLRTKLSYWTSEREKARDRSDATSRERALPMGVGLCVCVGAYHVEFWAGM